MAVKPVRRPEAREVIYGPDRWELLRSLRARAAEVMETLEARGIGCIVHGSIARGDVRPTSDIDVFVPSPPPSAIIEAALEFSGLRPVRRVLVQATPHYVPKGYIELDERTSVSFPLAKMRPIEREFYTFGGELDLRGLRAGLRVPGVDKRLMLIEPTERGHVESSILGREGEVARLLGISVETVMDRVRALLRRDEVGRTGVFIKRELGPGESFEAVLAELASENPAVRRRLRGT